MVKKKLISKKGIKRTGYKRKASGQVLVAPLYKQPTSKGIVAKLSYREVVTTSVAGAIQSIQNLLDVLLLTTDWANYKAAYSLFSIKKISVIVDIAPVQFTIGLNAGTSDYRTWIDYCAIGYDPYNGTALGANAILELQTHAFDFCGGTEPRTVTLSFVPKATGSVPISTAYTQGTQNLYGWFKQDSQSKRAAAVEAVVRRFYFWVVFGERH
jgi:hypothetical protein